LNIHSEINSIKQINIIKKATSYINITKYKYYDSSLNYLDSLEPCPGYGLIQYWMSGLKKIPVIIFFILKDLVLSFYEKNFVQISKAYDKKYKNIIVSWSKNNNFLKNGSYNDPYFNTNSNINKKNCLWFLIHMDDKIPKKISKNIILIKKINGKFNYKKFIFFFINLKKLIKNFNSIIHRQSYQTIVAYSIFGLFKNLLNYNVKKIIMPYEGQVFQNLIIKKSENFNNKIETIGFVHNFPSALPTNLIHRNGSPKKIIVNGVDQLRCLSKYLFWPKNKILSSESARFIKKKKNMYGKIYLPGHINSINFIITNLKKILLLYPNANIKNFEIKNHPHKLKSKNHITLVRNIKQLLKECRTDNDINKNYKKISIFIGSTGAIGEALEYGCSVIHIVENSTLQTYNNKLFPSIVVKVMTKDIFQYSLIRSGNLIKFGKKLVTFDKYMNI
jgi:hypothetical protein